MKFNPHYRGACWHRWPTRIRSRLCRNCRTRRKLLYMVPDSSWGMNVEHIELIRRLRSEVPSESATTRWADTVLRSASAYDFGEPARVDDQAAKPGDQ